MRDSDVIALDDPCGSFISDILGETLKCLGYEPGDKVPFEMKKKRSILPFCRTFMDAPVGDPLLYIDSRDRVGLAVNQGNYSKKYDIAPPATIFVPRKSAPLTSKTHR